MGHFSARLLLALSLVSLSLPAFAAIKAEQAIDNPALLSQLVDQAQSAKPSEQAFLYVQVVHVMTEIAGRAIVAGDIEKAAATLKQIPHYAELIHLGLAKDTHRLREAEILMHTTTHHLGQYLHMASSDDKAEMQATLTQLDKVNDELLSQVFQH
jgi:hypothetical protein